MKKIINFIRYDSTLFLYPVSLFLLINHFGISGNSVISAVLFVLLSVLLNPLFRHKSRFVQESSLKSRLTDFSAVISVLLSLFIETGIIVNVFTSLSDAESGVFDKCIFVLIIIVAAFVISYFNNGALVKISNILFLLPIIAIIPIILSIPANGINIRNFLSFEADEIEHDILNGIFLFLIFSPDTFVSDQIQSHYSNSSKRHNNTAIILSTAYITVMSLLICVILGENIYKDVLNPVFAVSSTVEFFEFDEIILIIYSLCLIYRFSCKLKFVNYIFKKYIHKIQLTNTAVFILSSIFAVAGVLLYEKGSNLSFYLTLYGLITVILFILSQAVKKP